MVVDKWTSLWNLQHHFQEGRLRALVESVVIGDP